MLALPSFKHFNRLIKSTGYVYHDVHPNAQSLFSVCFAPCFSCRLSTFLALSFMLAFAIRFILFIVDYSVSSSACIVNKAAKRNETVVTSFQMWYICQKSERTIIILRSLV